MKANPNNKNLAFAIILWVVVAAVLFLVLFWQVPAAHAQRAPDISTANHLLKQKQLAVKNQMPPAFPKRVLMVHKKKSPSLPLLPHRALSLVVTPVASELLLAAFINPTNAASLTGTLQWSPDLKTWFNVQTYAPDTQPAGIQDIPILNLSQSFWRMKWE
jgi:hypothetical protein